MESTIADLHLGRILNPSSDGHIQELEDGALALSADGKVLEIGKASALKAELDGLGVAWRGVCFEKEDLVNALVDARASPAPSWADVLVDASATAPPPSPPPPSPSPAVPPTSRSDAFANSVLADAQPELADRERAEGAQRGLGHAAQAVDFAMADLVAAGLARPCAIAVNFALHILQRRSVGAGKRMCHGRLSE